MIVHKAIRKYGDRIVVSVLCEDETEFCELIEWAYRPKPNIAWNTLVGGAGGWAGVKRCEESILKRRTTISCKVVHPWQRYNSNHILWKNAQVIYTRYESGCSSLQISKEFSVSSSSVENLLIRISEGWVPCKDSAWLDYSGFDSTLTLDCVEPLLRNPWDHPLAIPWIWENAAYLQSIKWRRGEARKMERDLGLPHKCLKTILKKFKSGWLPSEDTAWLDLYTKH